MITWTRDKNFPISLWETLLAEESFTLPGSPKVNAKAMMPTKNVFQVQLHLHFGDASLLLVVAKDGWEHKYEGREKRYHNNTVGKQVRWSSNAALKLSLQELYSITEVIGEALRFVEKATAKGVA